MLCILEMTDVLILDKLCKTVLNENKIMWGRRKAFIVYRVLFRHSNFKKTTHTGASGAESATPLSRFVWANSFMLPISLSLAQALTADSMRFSLIVLLYFSLLSLSLLGTAFLSPSLSSLLNFSLRAACLSPSLSSLMNFSLRAASFSFRAISLYKLELSFFSFLGVSGVLGCSSAFDLCRNFDVSTNGACVCLKSPRFSFF